MINILKLALSSEISPVYKQLKRFDLKEILKSPWLEFDLKISVENQTMRSIGMFPVTFKKI